MTLETHRMARTCLQCSSYKKGRFPFLVSQWTATAVWGLDSSGVISPKLWGDLGLHSTIKDSSLIGLLYSGKTVQIVVIYAVILLGFRSPIWGSIVKYFMLVQVEKYVNASTLALT